MIAFAQRTNGRSVFGTSSVVGVEYGAVVYAIAESRVTPGVIWAGSNDGLVHVTRDNGAHWTPEDKATWPHLANAHWRGMKADIWDAGHRIPFLARWPGKIKPGAVCNQLGCLTDLMATAAGSDSPSSPLMLTTCGAQLAMSNWTLARTCPCFRPLLLV